MVAADPLTELGVVEAVTGIRSGSFTSVELVEACLARIGASDGELRAWVTVDADGARRAAIALDARLRAVGRVGRGGRGGLVGQVGPLHGVPVGIKDIVDVAGLPTTAGAAAFAHTSPERDATLVARLRDAGAVILGKTVPTQFAYKDPAVTRNPWSAARTPGGSSSGSAAAVAARQVPVAIGTQTVGSILRPAAYCGVVGFKGAFGRVPLDGVVPLAWSFDHGGPIARSVADAILVHDVLSGAPDAVERLERPRFGVARELMDRADPGLRAHLAGIIAALERDGATIIESGLPRTVDELIAAGRITLGVEAAAYHRAAFAIHESDYGPGIAELIRDGLARTADEAAEAERIRAAYREAVAPILAGVDALLSPVAPGPAPLLDAGTGDNALCAPWSFLGVPAISLPTGLDGDGLPLAIQLVGGTAGQARLLAAAGWVESVVGFSSRPEANG